MRKLTWVTVMLLAMPALADKTGTADAAAAVKATLDKADEALNTGNAKLLTSLFDKSFFYAGSTVSAKDADVESAKADIEKMLANGPVGRLTRGETSIKTDDDGDTAWYIAEYLMVPKVGQGVLPVHRKLRESGVMVKRGKEWKFAMVHQGMVMPDPPKPNPPATPPPAAK